jgi:hypothetical protein
MIAEWSAGGDDVAYSLFPRSFQVTTQFAPFIPGDKGMNQVIPLHPYLAIARQRDFLQNSISRIGHHDFTPRISAMVPAETE